MGTGSKSLIPARIGMGLSLVLFGVPALLLWVATHRVVPILVERGWEPKSSSHQQRTTQCEPQEDPPKPVRQQRRAITSAAISHAPQA